MYSQATVPHLIAKSDNKLIANTFAIASGVLLLSLLAQVTIPLPWTPVPITGQTFGVSLVSLLWGLKRGGAVLALYLLLGSLGAPVFAMGKSGLLLGPTLGYLFGMLAASFVMGYLADKGFTNNFTRSLVSAYAGSLVIFSFGVWGLSYFVPTEALFVSGVLPFLPGNAIKNLLAAYLCVKLRDLSLRA